MLLANNLAVNVFIAIPVQCRDTLISPEPHTGSTASGGGSFPQGNICPGYVCLPVCRQEAESIRRGDYCSLSNHSQLSTSCFTCEPENPEPAFVWTFQQIGFGFVVRLDTL